MKTIAFCIPVMNRTEDVKSTLTHNLSIIHPFRERVKIYINCFDADSELKNFVFSNFSKELKSGILQFNQLPALPHWHFSWAKNSFKNLIKEDYYSSLDGDNYLAREELVSLFELMDTGDDFIFHGFSGNWGDGTSGRITLPTALYKKYGYLDEINPRQVDEIGVLGNVLRHEANIKFVTYEGCDVRLYSGAFRKWVELSSIEINHVEIERPEIQAPENPKGAGYYKKDPVVNFYQNFNSAYTYQALSTTDSSRNHFSKLLSETVANVDPSQAQDVFSKAFVHAKTALSGEVTLYSVIKDDTVFLSKWLEHYRKLGVERFIIVDDYSTEPIADSLYGNDVFIFKPLIGKFKTCKFLWLEMLMRCYQEPDSWALTVDSDEFLSLDSFGNSIKKLSSALDKHKQNFAVALLVDMLPEPGLDFEQVSAQNFIDKFNRFYLRPHTPNAEYKNNHSVKWAFDAYWTYSHRLDVRWRYFKTVDSLRKFPLIKYAHDIRLNQGFHALNQGGKPVNPRMAFYRPEFILPLRHYKFVNYFTGVLAKRDLAAYHSRTEDNLRRIQQKQPEQLAREMEMSPFVQGFSVKLFSTLLHRPIGYYRVLGNNMPGLHADEQTIINLKHILEKESDFAQADKCFIVNRIVSAEQRDAIIRLLKQHSARYEVIDFCLEDFLSVGYSLENLPTADWWFKKKTNWENIASQMAIRADKNRYLMNNNGARNFCLEDGIRRYQWVMPWDGNCFLSDQQAKELFNRFSSRGEFKYISTPMERALSNDQVHAKAVANNAVEEPQLSFHHSAKERFNEKLPYGNQPKVELFKRLGYKGVWDKWVNQYPWKKLQFKPSPEAGLLAVQSSVFRLFSGNVAAANNSDNRANTRGLAIADFIDSVEAEYLARQPLKQRLVDLFTAEAERLQKVPSHKRLLAMLESTEHHADYQASEKDSIAEKILFSLVNSILSENHLALVRAKIDAFVLLNSNQKNSSSTMIFLECVFRRVLNARVGTGALDTIKNS